MSTQNIYDAVIRAARRRLPLLAAGQDKECVENSNWDAAHTRHASRILRFYRNDLYQKILERLPYAEVTPPSVDWDERRKFVAAALNERT